MRKCGVKNCPNSEETVLCHRFPKNRDIARKWQNALNLGHISLDTLMSKFIICYMHFNCTDYRCLMSDCLNCNAIPQVRASNPRPNHGKVERQQNVCRELSMEKQEVNSPTYVSDSMLHEETDKIENSIETPLGSNASILSKEQSAADSLIQSTDDAGSTMLDAASGSIMNDNTSDIPDGSKDLKLDNESDSGNSHDLQPDSTDSNVEDLVCESMNESQSSEIDISASVLKLEQTDTDSIQSPGESEVLSKTNDSIDIEYYEHLDKQQLIEIAKQQSEDIEELKSKLETLMSTQKPEK